MTGGSWRRMKAKREEREKATIRVSMVNYRLRMGNYQILDMIG